MFFSKTSFRSSPWIRTHDSRRLRENRPLFSTDSCLSKFVEKFCCTPKCLHRKVPKCFNRSSLPFWSKLLTQTSCTAEVYYTPEKTEKGPLEKDTPLKTINSWNPCYLQTVSFNLNHLCNNFHGSEWFIVKKYHLEYHLYQRNILITCLKHAYLIKQHHHQLTVLQEKLGPYESINQQTNNFPHLSVLETGILHLRYCWKQLIQHIDYLVPGLGIEDSRATHFGEGLTNWFNREKTLGSLRRVSEIYTCPTYITYINGLYNGCI